MLQRITHRNHPRDAATETCDEEDIEDRGRVLNQMAGEAARRIAHQRKTIGVRRRARRDGRAALARKRVLLQKISGVGEPVGEFVPLRGRHGGDEEQERQREHERQPDGSPIVGTASQNDDDPTDAPGRHEGRHDPTEVDRTQEARGDEDQRRHRPSDKQIRLRRTARAAESGAHGQECRGDHQHGKEPEPLWDARNERADRCDHGCRRPFLRSRARRPMVTAGRTSSRRKPDTAAARARSAARSGFPIAQSRLRRDRIRRPQPNGAFFSDAKRKSAQ